MKKKPTAPTENIVYSNHDLTTLMAATIQQTLASRIEGKAEWTFLERRVAVYMELLIFRSMATREATAEVAKRVTGAVTDRTRLADFRAAKKKKKG